MVDSVARIRLWHFLFYPIPVATMVAKPAMGMQDRFAALAALFHQFHSAQNAEKLILLNMREVTTLRAKAVAIYLFVVSVCGHDTITARRMPLAKVLKKREIRAFFCSPGFVF